MNEPPDTESEPVAQLWAAELAHAFATVRREVAEMHQAATNEGDSAKTVAPLGLEGEDVPCEVPTVCGAELRCGGPCLLPTGHAGPCECGGDEPGRPGTCPG